MIEKKTIFIRHNFNNSKYSTAALHSKKLIAIHFTEQYHDSFEKYTDTPKHFKRIYETFEKLGNEGGLVVIQYNPRSFYIGEINPRTAILPYNIANENEPVDFLKTLSVAKLSSEFLYADYPLFSAVRPPFSTIATLNRNSKNLIDHLYYGKPLELLYSNLHPKMAEQMCEEWMRSDLSPVRYRIKYGLLKTGKTLPTIDIYAETIHDKYLCVQVTLGNEKNKLTNKLTKLDQYVSSKNKSKDVIGLFISDDEGENLIKSFLNVEFVHIKTIFYALVESKVYHNMIRKMMGMNE